MIRLEQKCLFENAQSKIQIWKIILYNKIIYLNNKNEVFEYIQSEMKKDRKYPFSV